ncbi:MAG: dTMP kinase [Elusimicrobiota bacterium]
MERSKKSFFLVLEGLDKCGKSTQARLLEHFLRRNRIPCLLTREPGGTGLGERIRDLLLKTKGHVADRAELLLYEASRAQHVTEKIAPALAAGKFVICDRFTLSTVAYQGLGRGIALSDVKGLNDFACHGVSPDLTIVFDLPIGECERRMTGTRDRMERERSFLRKVRKAYLRLVGRMRDCVLLDAARPPDAIHGHIVKLLVDRGAL